MNFSAILRLLPPETAHDLVIELLSRGLVPKINLPKFEKLKCRIFGRELDHPIGLASGFDKNARAFDGLFNLGFSFIEIGSITLNAQVGNAKPRIFRFPKQKAIVNHMGMPNDGAEVIAKRLKGNTKPIGISLGDNPEKLIEKFTDVADYFVLNISCPNVKHNLNLTRLKSNKPIFIKLSPDLSNAEYKELARFAIDTNNGLIISNTLRSDFGGLSGKPLKERSTQLIKKLYCWTEGRVEIIGVGGISSGKDAYEKICAGSSAVQIYTAMIYEGHRIVEKIVKELQKIKGYSCLKQIIGKNA